MDRKAFDAHEGLKEGRRVNPGAAKLPTQLYMRRGDKVLLLVASVLALGLIAYAPEITEGLWKLLKSALAVVTSAGR